jgi:hypothetical protein
MSRERRFGGGINLELGVAVVGGDEDGSALLNSRSDDRLKAGVDGFDGLNGGVEFAGVPDHVGVGEVHDDEIVLAHL